MKLNSPRVKKEVFFLRFLADQTETQVMSVVSAVAARGRCNPLAPPAAEHVSSHPPSSSWHRGKRHRGARADAVGTAGNLKNTSRSPIAYLGPASSSLTQHKLLSNGPNSLCTIPRPLSASPPYVQFLRFFQRELISASPRLLAHTPTQLLPGRPEGPAAARSSPAQRWPQACGPGWAR